jgi:hypothetical protein
MALPAFFGPTILVHLRAEPGIVTDEAEEQ